jgi:hypothetical protein
MFFLVNSLSKAFEILSKLIESLAIEMMILFTKFLRFEILSIAFLPLKTFIEELESEFLKLSFFIEIGNWFFKLANSDFGSFASVLFSSSM